MELGVTFLIISISIIAIWIIIEIKRLKHKLFAIFLIILIIFFYLSFIMIFKDRPIDYKSLNGISEAGGIYINWLGSLFKNLKTITGNAINMEWGYQENKTNT